MKKDLREVYWARTERPPKRRSTSPPRSIRPSTAGAIECLVKDRDALVAFYDFLAEHWHHLRTTTNLVESVFATGRDTMVRTKGSLSPTTARPMVFKLVIAASRTWRRLNGINQSTKVVAVVRSTTALTSSKRRQTKRLITSSLKSRIAQLTGPDNSMEIS